VAALDWGHPRTAAALVDHLDAGRIRRSFHAEMLTSDTAALRAHAEAVAAQAEGDLGALALLAAGGGVVWLFARRGRRAAGAFLLAVAVGDVAYAVWLNPMGIADRQTGVPLALALAALAGVGVAAGARVLGRAAPYGAAALVVLLGAQPLLGGARAKLAGRDDEAARAWAEAALAAAPPSALALARSDSMAAALFWLTLAEPVRPDVAALARQHLWDRERTLAVLGEPVSERSRRDEATLERGPAAPREGAPSKPGAAGAAAAERANGAMVSERSRREEATLERGAAERAGAAAAERANGATALGDLLAQARARGRAVVWELGDDPAPPLVPGVPVGWLGAPGLPLAAQVAAAERAFAAPATDEEGTAVVAARAFLDLGALASRGGDLPLAVRLTERALALGDAPLAHVNQARYLLALGDDAGARRHAEAAAARAPGQPGAWSLLGVLDARAGRCAEARRHLERALALDPADHDAILNLTRLALCRAR
jgi:tetratricopeptide (TPR) repeat protein